MDVIGYADIFRTIIEWLTVAKCFVEEKEACIGSSNLKHVLAISSPVGLWNLVKATSVDQDRWVREALEMFGRIFGGATAYPRAKGVWRDDERKGALVFDEPVVIHCYTSLEDIEDDSKLAELGAFCRRMGREAKQGEVGLIIAGEYIAIRNFAEGGEP